MKSLFKHKDGKQFEYIKEIKEIGNSVIARFRGAIDSATIPIIASNIRKRGKRYLNKNVLVDFEDVTHVDSSTLAELLILLDELQSHHAKLGVVNVPVAFMSYLQVERVESAVRVYESEDAALRDFVTG